MAKINYILGSDSITVFLDGNSFTINKEAQTYKTVLNAVRGGNVDVLRDAVNIKQGIVNGLQKTSKGKVTIDGSEIYYDDRLVTGLISSRIFDVLEAGLDVQPMVRFLENLMDNPSKRAVDELFSFIDACRLPITEDGHFLAYKRVRGDYKDCHSGSLDNSVGNVLEMPRNLVDEDKNNTCSYGLHFCSYDYLAHFGGERIVVLKINPRDVVAIPADYNNSKGRTCRYEVVDELALDEYRMPVTRIKDGFTTDYSNLDYDADADWDSSDYVDDYDDYAWDESEAADETFVIVNIPNSPFVKPVTAKAPVVLTDADKKAIRAELKKKNHKSLAQLARDYGVSPRTIGRIRDSK